MKKQLIQVVAVVATIAASVVAVSCGPSAGQVKTAREARYKGDPATLYAAVKAATESRHKIATSDEAALALQTEGRWYTPEGQVDTARGENLARLQQNSINFSVLVRLVKGDTDSYTVSVEPIALRMSGPSSQPEPLDLKDPSVPGWVHGKADSLQLDIHERLKPYAVSGASVPAMVPAAPAPAPSTDPAPAPATDPAPSTDPAAPESAPAAPAPTP